MNNFEERRTSLTYFAICVSHVSGVFNFILLPAMAASKCPGSPENPKTDSSVGYLESVEIRDKNERKNLNRASSGFRECAHNRGIFRLERKPLLLAQNGHDVIGRSAYVENSDEPLEIEPPPTNSLLRLILLRRRRLTFNTHAFTA